ncbi:MAG: DNA polymerase III subunit chi [Mariprofundaceae bacterium]|nr:DNA polymerase III subunit chi [Mariprofundaceae bacterium]
METKVHFELLEKPDRIMGIAQLLARRPRLQPHVLILCPDDDFMQQLDERLWTTQAEAFLPHAIAGSDSAENAQQPILLTTTMNRDNQPQVLVNGGLEVPTELSGFSHLVDFVDAWDEGLKQAARERFKTYRQLSFEPTYIGKK